MPHRARDMAQSPPARNLHLISVSREKSLVARRFPSVSGCGGLRDLAGRARARRHDGKYLRPPLLFANAFEASAVPGKQRPEDGSVVRAVAALRFRATRWFHRLRSLAVVGLTDLLPARSVHVHQLGPHAYPLYFTCTADFLCLKLSIQSLSQYAGSTVQGIYVYQDRMHPLTLDQRSELAASSSYPIVFRTTAAPMTWGGITLLHNELRAFLDMSRELGPDDFIVKVDSDILFTADWFFPRLLGVNADLIGQPVSSFATHTTRDVPDVQGGCYWLRAGAVFQLRSASLLAAARAVVKTSRYDLWTVPEDRTISQWAHNAKLKVYVEDYYLLDLARLRSRPLSSDLEIEACLSQATPFGVIHFERCKAKMAPCFEWLTRGERHSTPPSSMASRG
jgi:hypothetical protein